MALVITPSKVGGQVAALVRKAYENPRVELCASGWHVKEGAKERVDPLWALLIAVKGLEEAGRLYRRWKNTPWKSDYIFVAEALDDAFPWELLYTIGESDYVDKSVLEADLQQLEEGLYGYFPKETIFSMEHPNA